MGGGCFFIKEITSYVAEDTDNMADIMRVCPHQLFPGTRISIGLSTVTNKYRVVQRIQLKVKKMFEM